MNLNANNFEMNFGQMVSGGMDLNGFGYAT
jgi:hypothetical protein